MLLPMEFTEKAYTYDILNTVLIAIQYTTIQNNYITQ